MEDEENLRAEGFIEASRKKGHLRASMGSDTLDSDYDAVNCVTPQGNMGYTTASVGDKPVTFFCSITARGMVTTLPDPGLNVGPEITVRGTKMHFVPGEATLKAMLAEHKKALIGENVIMNRARLEKELDILPQKVVDLMLAYAQEKGLK
jgi:hypothetical protein